MVVQVANETTFSDGYLDTWNKFSALACGTSSTETATTGTTSCKDPSGCEGPIVEPDFNITEAMARGQCGSVIYVILANDNPEVYPLEEEDKPISMTYNSTDGACSYHATMLNCTQSGDGPEQCKESTVSETVENCDCSDPKKYNFQNKGRFKILALTK